MIHYTDLGYAFLFLEYCSTALVKSSEVIWIIGLFSLWTYKVTSAASICMHHKVVTDQYTFARNI